MAKEWEVLNSDILEKLYIEYYQVAFLYTISLCKNKEIAEDIVSEAFIKAYITLNEEKKEFKYWLFVVCRNLWIDGLRKRKYLTDQMLDDNQLISSENVEMSFITKERNQILYRSIMKINHQYRECLLLHYFGNLKLNQIAAIMNISNSYARTLVSRARMKLKEKLEDEGYEF